MLTEPVNTLRSLTRKLPGSGCGFLGIVEDMEKSKFLLVVDDDARLRDLLQRYLTDNGFTVETLPDGRDLERWLTRQRPALLIMDVMMPGEDGLAIVRRLRAQQDPIPVLMLTARGDEIDRIIGLEMGADDYLPKPFNPRELLARVNAILRRQTSAPATLAPRDDTQVAIGEHLFMVAQRRLRCGEVDHSLTNAEYGLLKVLVERPRQPLSREQLMDLAFGKEHEVFDRSVDVHISRLRKLLERDVKQPQLIQTVWGFGYVYVPQAETHGT